MFLIMRKSPILVALFFLLAGPLWGEPLHTPFFSAKVPDGWTVSRTSGGLWSFSPSNAEQPEEFTVLPVHLNTTPEIYLKATSKLWRLRGEVEPVTLEESEPKDTAAFVLRPKDTPDEWQLKIAHWKDHGLVMVTYMFPVKHWEQAKAEALSFTGNLEPLRPEYRRQDLMNVLAAGLKSHKDDREELADLNAVKTEMASFRVDWEPFFPDAKPRLYQAYRAYLESRFDAAFALNNGQELGMPESLIQERMEAVQSHRKEVEQALQSPDSEVDGL